jgi:hypothetical protein
MNKLEQQVVVNPFILKGIRPQEIQIEPGSMYHEQAFQLPLVGK